MTILRLELQAALIGTRISTLIQSEQEFLINRRVFWTDSKVFLYWIERGPSHSESFVANRLEDSRED